MSDIGDMVINMHQIPYLVVGCREMANKVYLFSLYNMYTAETQDWLEPHERQLAPSYWQYLG